MDKETLAKRLQECIDGCKRALAAENENFENSDRGASAQHAYALDMLGRDE